MAGLLDVMPPQSGGLLGAAPAPAPAGLLGNRADWIKQYEQFAGNKDWRLTELAPAEEAQFRQWLPQTKMFERIRKEIAAENNLNPATMDVNKVIDMMTGGGEYDYRGAFKGGVEEVISPHDGFPHWSSTDKQGRMLKAPNHPTAWMEFFMRNTQTDPESLGLHDYEAAKNWQMRQGSR